VLFLRRSHFTYSNFKAEIFLFLSFALLCIPLEAPVRSLRLPCTFSLREWGAPFHEMALACSYAAVFIFVFRTYVFFFSSCCPSGVCQKS